jgi:hypothetical protein
MAPKNKGGRPKSPDGGRTQLVQIRGRPEWRAALERAAEFDRARSVSEFIDRAVAHYARAIRFTEAIPPR